MTSYLNITYYEFKVVNPLVTVKFKRTIRQSGGSAAIAVPPELLEALNWKIGDSVEIYIDDQKLIIKKF